MNSFDITVPIAAGVGPGAADRMAVTVHLPALDELPERPVVVMAVPGGGYGRGYFDMRFPGRSGYSQAEHHDARGIVTVAIDHIGVGESSLPDPATIEFEHLAASHDACCRAVLSGLTAGTLIDGVAPLTPAAAIGIGQSMGGCVTLLTQANHATFDGIAVLGFSAIRTRLPQRDASQEDRNAALVAEMKRGDTHVASSDVTMQDYVYPFHWEDVPNDVLSADMAGGYPIRQTVPPFGSGTIPNCAVQMMIPGVVGAEAARITVPVFVGNGARDVCPDPRAEPGAYAASGDITTVVVPQMAHMHNFASSRGVLWDRLARWYGGVAARPA